MAINLSDRAWRTRFDVVILVSTFQLLTTSRQSNDTLSSIPANYTCPRARSQRPLWKTLYTEDIQCAEHPIVEYRIQVEKRLKYSLELKSEEAEHLRFWKEQVNISLLLFAVPTRGIFFPSIHELLGLSQCSSGCGKERNGTGPWVPR